MKRRKESVEERRIKEKRVDGKVMEKKIDKTLIKIRR